ncbi:MAG: alpha/beta hydrolase [Methanobrevibacter sp.]|nr:alpha/beta hydrolase [Methanobrevibacter sp.]
MTLKYFNNLAYEEIGEKNSEIILFLHTKLLDKWIWKKQKENYNEYFNEYHCIFLDLPNHGDSKSDEDFSIKSSADEIMKFIKNLIDNKKIEKVNLVALGIGGSIAIEIINKEPQIIDNLILSGLEIADYAESENDSVVDRLAKTQSEYLNEKPDTFITKAYLRYFGIKKEHYNDVERILDRTIKEEKRIAFESLNYTIPENLRNNDEIIKKENILIIYGSKEDLNSTKSAIELKSIFKNARLVEIIKGNHLWNIIDYDLFNIIITDFIKDNHIEKNSKIVILE